MTTFRSAGDLGDCVYQMPAIRALGGGIVLLEAATYTRQMLTPDKWCGIDLLMKSQPYIANVREWRFGEQAGYNLNDFRARLFKSVRMGQNKNKALVDWILEAHGLPLTAKDEAWISVEPRYAAKVIFNRTGAGRLIHHVYHNEFFPWRMVCEKYGKEAMFIGSPEEHRAFVASFCNVPYLPTENLLEAARVIAGAKLFIGNQSVCHAIAEGLKQRIVLEVWPGGPNCLHFRDGVYHGWDENVVLPDL